MSLVLEVKSGSSGRSVLFMKFNAVYPNCEFLISDEPQLHPLKCLIDSCHRNQNCMETLAHRVKYVFDQWPSVDVLVLYFRYRDFPTKHRAGVFGRDMGEPRYITFNPYAWEKIKTKGVVYEWDLPSSLMMGAKLHQIGKSGG